MNKLPLLLLFIIFYGNSQAQQRQVGLTNSALFVDQTIRLLATPTVEIKTNDNAWEVGPTIIYYSEYAASDRKYPKLSGFSISYLHYPFQQTKKFNFYFYTTSIAQLINNRWSSSIWNDEQGSYMAYSYKSDELLITQHFGYAVIYKLTDNFHLSQGVGLGGYYSTTDNNEQSAGAPEIEDFNLSGYERFGFTWLLNFEISYSLNN